MNIKNLYGEPLILYLYNYDNNGHHTYTDYIDYNQIKPLYYFYNKMLIFYKYKNNIGLFTPLDKNKSINNFTINIQNLNNSPKLTKIKSSDITISTFISDMQYFYDQNCNTSVGSVNDQICIDLNNLIQYLSKFIINVENPNNYTYFYVLFNIDDNNNINSYSVNNVNDYYDYLQFVIYSNGKYYLSGLIAILNYIYYYSQITVNLNLTPDNTYNVYTELPQTYNKNNTSLTTYLYFTTDISNYVNNSASVYLSINAAINIDASIFGLKTCIVIPNNALMDYEISYMDNNKLINISEYNLLNSDNNQYVFFLNVNYDNLVITGKDDTNFNIFQILSMPNNNNYLINKITLSINQDASLSPIFTTKLGDNIVSTLMYIFPNTNTGIIKQQINNIKSNNFKFISDIDMTLYLYFYDSDVNSNYTLTININSMIPLAMFMVYKDLEMLSYDSINYNLYQLITSVSSGITLTMNSQDDPVNTPIYIIANQNSNLYKIDCNIETYISPNCTVSTSSNITEIGSNNNMICVENKLLFESILKSNFVIYSDTPMTLYILNFFQNNYNDYNIDLVQVAANTYSNKTLLNFTFTYLQIIYTTDSKTYGIFNICDLTDVIQNGCIINLILQPTTSKKEIKLVPGNNNLYYLSDNLGSIVSNSNIYKCISSNGIIIGPYDNNICVNKDMIKQLMNTNNTINSNTDYTIYIIIMLIIFSFIIIIFIIYMVVLSDKK